MIVAKTREQRSTYMATIVSSDPMRTRRNTIKFLALFGKALEAKRLWLEHRIVSFADGYHHFTTCLNDTEKFTLSTRISIRRQKLKE